MLLGKMCIVMIKTLLNTGLKFSQQSTETTINGTTINSDTFNLTTDGRENFSCDTKTYFLLESLNERDN